MAEQARRQQQDMVVIHKGERESALVIPVISGPAIAQLKKDGCKAYAKDHGLPVIRE